MNFSVSMPRLENSGRMTVAVHALAVLIGVIFGMFDARIGLSAFFSITNRDTATGVVAILLFGFSLLPVAVIGIRRPGLASKCAAFSVCLYLFLVVITAAESVATGKSIGFDPFVALLFPAPCFVVAGAFWHVNHVRRAIDDRLRHDDSAPTGAALRRQSKTIRKWAGIAIGAITTLFLYQMAFHLIRLSAVKHDWFLIAGLLLLAFGPISMSILALMRTAWAGYGAFACLFVSLTVVFLADRSPFGVLFGCLVEIPTAVMGALFVGSQQRGSS